MKAKVLKEFRDKYTGEIHKPVGKILEISEKRFAEILKVGPFVEAVEEVTEEVAETTVDEKPKKTTKKKSNK